MRNQEKVKVLIVLILLLYSFINTMHGQVPINDSPCMSNTYHPYDLGTSGAHTGTTCGAVGYNDDPDADFQNVECDSFADDNSVWYRATYDPVYDGVSISIAAGSIGNSTAVEIYVGGADAVCDSTAEFRKAKCDGLPIEDMHIGCLENGDYVWIKVTSPEGDCGTFDISVQQINDCIVANECSDITTAQTFEPVTPEDISVNYLCTNGCLDLACPSDIDGGCDFSQNPTVWYKVNTDADADQLYTTVTTNGNWTPIWSVWYLGVDCSDLVNAAGNDSFPCSSQSIPSDLLVIKVTDNESFYISVTADPNGEPIDDPNFQICVTTIWNYKSCIDDLDVRWEITDRENNAAEPEGPPYKGPFCPGEELSVHISFHYDATVAGDDWLLGLIPKFGCGWDTDGFDFNTNAPFGNGRLSEWYAEDGDCPPMAMEDLSHLCTYRDTAGKLKLVNTLWEVVPDGVSCSNGLSKYDTLPGGYFWVQEGGSPECDPNNCSPSRKYGIGSPIVDVVWDFKIKVKEFDNSDDCLDCNDLSIIFQTFSDGAAGCWDDPVAECLIDKPQFSPEWKVECPSSSILELFYDTLEICNNEKIEMSMNTKDGRKDSIRVLYEDNPNISGEKEYIFPYGQGLVRDTLKFIDSTVCNPEVVKYFIEIVEDYKCKSNIDTIEVIVYPDISYMISKTDIDCSETNTGMASVSLNCPDSIISYLWSTGDTSSDISGLSNGVYKITLTNSGGCSVVDSVRINSLEFSADYDKTDIECIGDCTGKIEFLNFVNGNPPYSILWNTGDTTKVIDSLCEGTYLVTITDSSGCMINDTINIFSPLPFVPNTDMINAKCFGECNGSILINNVENAIEPVSYLWDSGDTTNYRENLCAGDYYVTITDSTGCSDFYSFSINQPDEILILIDSVLDITNSGLGAIYVQIKNDTDFVVSWMGPDGYISDSEDIIDLEKAGCYSLLITDVYSNCTADTTICIADKTGTIDINDKLNIKIYPNPADNIVYFDLDESTISKADIRIYNIAGIEINKFDIDQGNSVYKLNTGNIAQGLYIVKVLSQKGVEVKTFVISR